eukprot:Skav202489  [mRNA]  locus=scaffold1531:74727:80399:- [translate_table: standard]
MLQLLDLFRMPPNAFMVSVHFDCLMAGRLADGQWMAHQPVDLYVLNRNLVFWIQQRHHCVIQWTHVHGHSGDPMNEAADCVAWAALHQWIPAPAFEEVLRYVTMDFTMYDDWHWVWLIEAARHAHPALPRLRGHFLVFDVSSPLEAATRTSVPNLVPAVVRPTSQVREHRSIQLRIATANVLTLYTADQSAGAYLSARAEALIHAFDAAACDFVGVQETRSRLHGYASTDRFHILSSPADGGGHGGLQLWIRKRIPYEGRFLEIAQQDLRIEQESHGVMVVSVLSPDLMINLVVAHAPNMSHGDISGDWWRSFSSVIGHLRSPRVVMIDANARVGSEESDAIGPLHAETQNIPGTALHELLESSGMMAPQTFDLYHRGPSFTWQHPNGATARLDYLLIDQDCITADAQTEVSSVDLSLQRFDHFAVEGLFRLPLRHGAPLPDPPPALPDDQHVSSSAPPTVSWSCDVHSHAAALQGWLRIMAPPAKPTGPRKRHLSEATWHLIQSKNYHYRRLRQVQASFDRGVLRACFEGWARTCSASSHEPPDSCWMALIDRSLAHHWYWHRTLSAKVTAAVRADDRAYYEQLAWHQGKVGADEGFPAIWKVIRGLLPRNQRKRQASSRCIGPSLDALMQHFNQIEAGLPTSPEELHSQCVRRQLEQADTIPLQVLPQHLPTRVMLEQVTSRTKANRAPGPDQLSINLLKQVMPFGSATFYAFYLKLWVLAAEPLQGKGDQICPIGKKPGPLTISNVRGIMLMNCLNKLFHALLRKMALPTIQRLRLSFQLGGFQKQQTTFATLHLRSYCQAATKKGCSLATLFVDVRHAFHSMLREHVCDAPDHTLPEQLRPFLESEGLSWSDLCAEVVPHSKDLASHLPWTTMRVVQDMHSDTWFWLRGPRGEAPCLSQTWRGSRPGSPIADLIYNRLMSVLLTQLTQLINEDSTIQQAVDRFMLAVPCITWVDDIAVPLLSAQAADLVPLVQRIVPQVAALFRSFGLRLNLSRGKTEIVLQFRGPHAASHRQTLLFNEFCQIDLDDGTRLHATDTYKHFGVTFAQSFNLDAEVHQRLSKARTAYRQLSKTLFNNRRIPVALRLQLLESLILPVLLHGCGAWTLLSPRLYRVVDTQIVRWQRAICGQGFWNSCPLTGDQFRAHRQLPALSLRLAKHRVLLALQMAHVVPWEMTAALSAEDDLVDQSWLQALRHGLRWIIGEDPTHRLSGSSLTVEDIFQWMASSTPDDAKQVRRLLRNVLLQEKTIHEVSAGYQTFVQQCLEHNLVLSDPVASSDDPSTLSTHSCTTCGVQFGSIQALSAHKWKAHGIRSVQRQYMAGTTCPICGLCLWTTQRLQQHLQRSMSRPGGCFELLQQYYDPVPEEDRLRLNEVPDHLSHVDRLPAVPMVGPLRPLHETAWERHHALQVQQWQRRWDLEGYPEALDLSLASSYGDVFTTATRSWIDDSSLGDLRDLWCDALDRDPDRSGQVLWAFCQWGQTRLYDFLESLVDPDLQMSIERDFLDFVACFPMWSLLAWRETLDHAVEPSPVFSPPVSVPDTRSIRLREPLPDAFACPSSLLDAFTTRRVVHLPTWPGVPLVQDAQGQLHLWILHLYSGRRREGDCHHWLQQAAERHLPHLRVHMLSIDTAIHPSRCNLMGAAYELILRLCRRGAIGLILSGPPCETWSSARHLECRPGGPKPLRSKSRLWGLRHLSTAELKQLLNGSSLMVRGLVLELAALLSGGAAVMEHPMIPKDPTYATVWSASFHLHYLMQLPNARAVAFEQWRYGASCIKPTLLRSVGLPGFASRFLAHGDEPLQPRPTALLGGFDWMTKQYRTAAAKEYPNHMCFSLVDSALAALAHRLRSESPSICPSDQLQSDEKDWMAAVEHDSSTVFASHFRADYQPTSL